MQPDAQKGLKQHRKKKLLITTNSNSKSRLASSYSSQLRKSSGTRNARRKKSQQAWFPEGAASGRPILQDPKVKQLSTDSRPCRVPNNRLLRFAGWAVSLFCPGEARGACSSSVVSSLYNYRANELSDKLLSSTSFCKPCILYLKVGCLL